MGGIKSETCNNTDCRIGNVCTENVWWVSAAHMSDKKLYRAWLAI